MPNDRINLGFIGVGRMGGGHLNSFLKFPDVRIVSICDVRKDRRDNAKQKVDAKYVVYFLRTFEEKKSVAQ